MELANSLIERLFYHATTNPDHDAMVSRSLVVSYAQLAELVTNQVWQLKSDGVSQDSVVGIQCADDIDHLVIGLAAAHLGATSCTIPSHESLQVRASLRKRCKVTHLVQSAADLTVCNHNSAIQARSAALSAAQEAKLLFSTSGTTGDPKLVVHCSGDVVAQAHRHIDSPQERFACIASVEHNFAKRHRLYVVAAGATNVFLDTSDASLVHQCLTQAVNVLHVSAFQAQELLAQDNIKQLSNIRLKLGGGHVPIQLRQQLKDGITPHLQAGYGTTETGAIAFTHPQDLDAGESVGQPLPGIDIRVVCPNRKPIAIGERGELAIRCRGMFREYLGSPDKTAERLDDEWFYTGDIGYLDNEQRIYLCGRSDDMFVFNSMNIYPQDIEAAILEHPHIVDVAVIPKASATHGNIPVALLVFKENVKQRLPDVQKFVAKRVGVRSPRQFIIVPKIPKTAAGKTSRSAASALPKKSSEVRAALLALLSEQTLDLLKPKVIEAFVAGEQDIRLKQLEMDSLARMDFLVSLELEYDTVISPQALPGLRYLGNVAAQLLTPKVPTTLPAGSNCSPTQATEHPYVVRFFHYIFRYCRTVVAFNTSLATLEERITPLDVDNLYRFHLNGELLPADAAEKFQVAASHWLQETKSAMRRSGKMQPEPFLSRKIARSTRYFCGPGPSEQKTLLICYPPRDMNQMGIANPVFLQHIDAQRFDLLILSSPFETGYQLGKSKFQKNLQAFYQWVNAQDWIKRYRSIRTLGFSAGGRAAIATGYQLDAELAMSVNGRFHRKRHILKNLDQLLTIWRAAHKNQSRQVLLSYTPDNPRDRMYAKFMAAVSGGTKTTITHEQEQLKHLVFGQLLDQGELAGFLNQSILERNDRITQRSPETTSLQS